MLGSIQKRLFGACLAFIVVIIALCSVHSFGSMFVSHAVALNDLPSDYDGWETQYEYIDVDTTWHKDDNLVFDKPVFVDYATTLTIEAGAHVYLDGGGMTMRSGYIVANGTEDDPIVITSHDNHVFTVSFDQYVEGVNAPTSHLNYVHIKGGGSYDDSNCANGGVLMMNTLWQSVVNTALAANNCVIGEPALVYHAGKVLIEHSDFIDNQYADIVVEREFHNNDVESFFKVHSSNFESNKQSKAVVTSARCYEIRDANAQYKDYVSVPCHNEVDLRDNWWGNQSGPRYYASYFPELNNMSGEGLVIDGGGDALVKPFSGERFSNGMNCLEQCFSNVMFLPGVEASRLYAYDDPDCVAVNCENQLWEPNRNDDVRKLYLDSQGKSTDAYDIYTRDVIDELNVSGQNIYKSFIEKMDTLKDTDHLINDWAPEPYDWRLSLEDILQGGIETQDGISYIEATDTPHIITDLKHLASTSKTGKVTIVAHSNGGLVAKALMQKIGDAQTKKLIDTVILVASPQIGTPVSVGVMLHGYDQSYLHDLILSKATARGLAQNMPSAYGLLPSQEYFDTAQAPVATIDKDALPEWSAKYGEIINTHDELKNFLTDAYQRVDATSEDEAHPSQLRGSLLDDAIAQHAAIDAWTAPVGVRVVQIAGWGVPVTVSGIHYTSETKMLTDLGTHTTASHEEFISEPVFTEDGDGTVVTPSALFMGDAERYWVNLRKYNRTNIFNNVLNVIGQQSGIAHADIFEVPSLTTFIGDIIIHNPNKLVSDYDYISTQVPESNTPRLEYSLHSPLSLDLYDDEGRHTGLDKDGNIEEQIPGTYYRQFGEVKYIFSDASAKYHLVLNGYATGTFTLEIEELQGDVSQGKVSFKDMPTTDKTKVTLDIPDGVDSIDKLLIDEDGDGKMDQSIPAKQNIIVTPVSQDIPTTTLYAVSYQTEVSPTVNSQGQLDMSVQSKKHKASHKKEKKHTKSAREIRRSKKAALQRTQALKVKSSPAHMLAQPKSHAVQTPSNEQKNDLQVPQDFASQDTVVKLPYQEPSVWQSITNSAKNIWQSFKLPW